MRGSNSSSTKAIQTRTMSTMVLLNYLERGWYIIVLNFYGFLTSFDRFAATEAQRFHLFKQEYGMLNFLSIQYIKYPEYGYLFNGGQTVFGVDIVVSKPSGTWEDVSYEENIRDPILDWRLTNFSIRDQVSYTSDTFSSGGRNWWLSPHIYIFTRHTHTYIYIVCINLCDVSIHIQYVLYV